MWKITKNIIDEGEEQCPLFQSHDYREDVFAHQPTTKFRLLDDDGEVYFIGLITDECLNGPEDRAFSPLDELGRGYGCTEMQYRNNGQWETL